MEKAASLELESPLGFLSQTIFIYQYDNCLLFFNRATGKLLFTVLKETMQEVLLLVNVSADLNRMPLEVAFNSFLGINNAKASKSCMQFFNYLGNILAELLGVGCKPTAALNLLGLMNFATTFPPDLVVFQSYSVINGLLLESPIELATVIASCSIITDAAAFHDKRFLFQDIIFPGTTLGGHKVGNVLGNKDSLIVVVDVLRHILSVLPQEDAYEFFVQLLLSITIDAKPEKLYETFFDMVEDNSYTSYHMNHTATNEG